MNNSSLFEQLMMKLRTKADVASVLVCLEEFLDTFFSPKSLSEQQQIFQKLPKEQETLFVAAFATEPITPEKQIVIKKQIDELDDKLRRLKTIQLTIAFQPAEDTITLFSDWVKKNINKDLLLDLRFDKSIVGGAILVAGGAYKDYSIRKKLATRFQIQREDIMGLLE